MNSIRNCAGAFLAGWIGFVPMGMAEQDIPYQQGSGMLLPSVKPEQVRSRDLAHIGSSGAFQRYQNGPKTELSKIFYLLDRLKKREDSAIVFNGKEFDPRMVKLLIVKYIFRHFDRNSTAAEWINQHAYRSSNKGRIIYIKDIEGNIRILRDVLQEELKWLEKFS